MPWLHLLLHTCFVICRAQPDSCDMLHTIHCIGQTDHHRLCGSLCCSFAGLLLPCQAQVVDPNTLRIAVDDAFAMQGGEAQRVAVGWCLALI